MLMLPGVEVRLLVHIGHEVLDGQRISFILWFLLGNPKVTYCVR